MAKYQIELTEEAKIDLSFFSAQERKLIVEGIKTHLGDEPLHETKNRKKLRDNPIAPWELRLGNYRVFYAVLADIIVVTVVSVGHKRHNLLYIRNQEVKI
jgi:mRNA-degrading endonuclease RelE of RelBE toxin-antitoxin system